MCYSRTSYAILFDFLLPVLYSTSPGLKDTFTHTLQFMQYFCHTNYSASLERVKSKPKLKLWRHLKHNFYLPFLAQLSVPGWTVCLVIIHSDKPQGWNLEATGRPWEACIYSNSNTFFKIYRSMLANIFDNTVLTAYYGQNNIITIY